MEANPDSLTLEKVELLARAGVRRLTLGIQSIDPETQRRANRFNKPEKLRASRRRSGHTGSSCTST